MLRDKYAHLGKREELSFLGVELETTPWTLVSRFWSLAFEAWMLASKAWMPDESLGGGQMTRCRGVERCRTSGWRILDAGELKGQGQVVCRFLCKFVCKYSPKAWADYETEISE